MTMTSLTMDLKQSKRVAALTGSVTCLWSKLSDRRLHKASMTKAGRGAFNSLRAAGYIPYLADLAIIRLSDSANVLRCKQDNWWELCEFTTALLGV